MNENYHKKAVRKKKDFLKIIKTEFFSEITEKPYTQRK